ncbi:MAG: hypothetical protein BI182_03275 [Acetobacterium sp. MES1]|uniref:ABC transporter permease subunit n=1 Tax=Acetobacterium sp. MES1 TaxID=1899015 RepID=UPI000B9C861A|nr:ABC transporter permease subunit [Acetobacterium sp. MES1]OXS26743.1 MAG: hypothetical protein BI182_03275 [Acetobacterium sp. MES1]
MKRIFVGFCVVMILLLAGCSQAVAPLPPVETAKIGTMIGTVSESMAPEKYPKAEINRFNNYVDESAALMAGKIDYAIMDYATARNFVKSNEGTMVLPEALTDEVTAMALKKENTELNQKLNAVLNRYLSDGTMEEIKGHWFPEAGGDYEIVDVPKNVSGPVLRVAVTSLTEPRCFVQDGELTGMNVELLSRIAYELGMQVEFQDMDFKAMIDSLQSGNSDVVAAMYNTPERSEKVDFTAGYFPNPQVFVVKADRQAATEGTQSSQTLISSSSDLNKAGYTIGVPEGTPPEEVAKELMPNADISYFTQFMDGVAALKSGKVTAVIYDSSGVDRILLSNPDLVKLDEELGNIEIAAVVRLDDTAMNEQLNAFIKQYQADGTAAAMVKRWINNTGGEMPDIPKPQNPEKKITIITNGLTEPMNYYENGQLTGFDVEFMKRFASYANLDYEIITMDYQAMIPALQSGKGDVIISDFFKTDERGQEVLYTDAYVVLHNSALIRKDMAAASMVDQSIKTNEELNGKRVGFITGMVHIDNFRPLYQADEYEFNDFSSMLEALKSKKIDALLTSQSKVAEIIEQNPDLIALPPYADISSSIGVNKTNTQLGDALDATVKTMIDDGSLKAMTEKWMGENEDRKVLTPVDLTGEKGTLIAGVLGDDYPYSYYKDNELVGLEVDLARSLAARMGMNVEIKPMDFSAIIPSITSGKIDLAFYLAYTPERAASIRFLTPLKSDQAVAIVRNQAVAASTGGQQWAGMIASLGESFNKTFVVEDRYQLILEGLSTTIVISLLSLLFGSLLGALICAMRRSRVGLISGLAVVYIRLIQGVPIVLTLMILYYIIFASVDIHPVLIAVVGFSINFAAYSAEIFRTAIDATDKGQLEAAYALGFTRVASFFKVTLPQALRHILPIFKGEFISMVKMTSVVGYIAIQDLTKMTDIIRSRTFEAFFPLVVTAAIYFVITYLFILLLGKIEVQIDPKRRKRVVKGVVEIDAEVVEVQK